MQCSRLLCILALAFSSDAAHFRQEPVQVPVPVPITDLMTTQPQSASVQGQVGPSRQVVTDAVQPAVISQQQSGSEPVATMLVATQPAAQTLPSPSQPAQDNQPQAAAALAVNGAIQPPAGVVFPAHRAQVSSQPEARNVTKIAFGQITDLASEFHQLREDDTAHVKQLGVDIHLREHLEKQLHEAEERLKHDNAELAQETGSIVAAPSASSGVPQNDTGDASVVAAFVQANSTKVQAQSDQIALAAARDVKTLDVDIGSLHARDVNEMKALRGNAETRTALSAEIAKQRSELLAHSEDLAANLGQIRELVAPSQPAVVPDVAAATATGESSPSEALVQAQQDPSAAQETPAQETAPAPVTAATSAPEAAGASSWLR